MADRQPAGLQSAKSFFYFLGFGERSRDNQVTSTANKGGSSSHTATASGADECKECVDPCLYAENRVTSTVRFSDRSLASDDDSDESVPNPFTDSEPSDEDWIPSDSESDGSGSSGAAICDAASVSASVSECLPFDPTSAYEGENNAESHQSHQATDTSSNNESAKTNQLPADGYVSDSSERSLQYPLLSGFQKQPDVQVQIKSKKWSKQHACFYCGKLVIKMARHLETKHQDESAVAQILLLEKGSQMRRKAWVSLLKEGDYAHNFSVLEKQKGTIIPKYRGKHATTSNDFVPCSTCKGIYMKSKLSAHTLRCNSFSQGKGVKTQGAAFRQAKLMLPIPQNVSKSLWQNVIIKMKEDKCSKHVKMDSLILMFGERMYAKRDIEEHTSGQISGRMRELGRLVIDMKEQSSGEINNLTKAMKVEHFDKLVASVRNIAGYSDDTHSFGKGSLALKLGYSVKKCAMILKSEGIKSSNKETIESADQFLSLFTGNWCDHISSSAAQSLERRKFNRPQLLPCCKDVYRLYTYVKNLETEDYSTLAKATLCEISLFNRKRGGEVQRISIENVKEGMQNAPEIDEEIHSSLSPVERKLVQSLSRIEIRGKFNRRVAVLLTKSMLKKIKQLMEIRDKLSVKSKYLFASLQGERPYRGSDVIRLMAQKAGVSFPHLFTWTALRKQIATISQAIEITDTEQDQLAQFLGHDIRIHRDFYRLPHDILQKAKVAKILLQVNTGHNHEPGEDMEMELEAVDIHESDEDDEILDEIQDESVIGKLQSSSDSMRNPTETVKQSKPQTEGAGKREWRELERKPTETVKRCKSYSEGTGRRKWTELERNAVFKHLNVFIMMKKVPGKKDIEQALSKEQCLGSRTWKNIKDFCYNEIKKQ